MRFIPVSTDGAPAVSTQCQVQGLLFFFYEPESFVITELMFVGTYVWISHMHMCKIKQYPIFHYLTTTGHPLE